MSMRSAIQMPVMRRRVVGGSMLSRLNRVAKRSKIASVIADELGHKNIAGMLKKVGYARRKRAVPRRRRRRGGGFFSSIGNALGGIGSALHQGVGGLFGYGGRGARGGSLGLRFT